MANHEVQFVDQPVHRSTSDTLTQSRYTHTVDGEGVSGGGERVWERWKLCPTTVNRSWVTCPGPGKQGEIYTHEYRARVCGGGYGENVFRKVSNWFLYFYANKSYFCS